MHSAFYHLNPQPTPGIQPPHPAGQQTPLLIERYSDSYLAGPHQHSSVNIRISHHPAQEHVHSSSKTQQVFATSSARSGALCHQLNHLRRLPTSNNSSQKSQTTSASRPLTSTNTQQAVLQFFFCNQFGSTKENQNRTKHIQVRFL